MRGLILAEVHHADRSHSLSHIGVGALDGQAGIESISATGCSSHVQSPKLPDSRQGTREQVRQCALLLEDCLCRLYPEDDLGSSLVSV